MYSAGGIRDTHDAVYRERYVRALGGRVELDATRMADQARKAGPLIVTEIPHPYWFGEKRNAKTHDLMAGAKAKVAKKGELVDPFQLEDDLVTWSSQC